MSIGFLHDDVVTLELNVFYNICVLQQDPYHHEPTGSPSYGNNLPPVQPMESLFPNQPLPPVQYNQPQVYHPSNNTKRDRVMQ